MVASDDVGRLMPVGAVQVSSRRAGGICTPLQLAKRVAEACEAQGGVRAGEVVNGDMLVPRARFLRSAFYREFMQRLCR